MTPVAALDCGTNSTRLLVVDDAGTPLARRMRITRLGQGVDASGVLRDDAVDRTVRALRDYRDEMDRLGATSGRLVATSAVRDAANGSSFLAAATAAAGVEAELLSGEEEGRLSFAGATADLDPPLDATVVVDIGGGSTEFVVALDGNVRAHSMQLGCVRLTERDLPSDPPRADELVAAIVTVDHAIDLAFEGLASLSVPDEGRREVVGLAGTVSTIAMLDLGLATYDEARVHHHWLSLDAISHWRATLCGEPAAARRSRPGMVEGREDVIAAGALILERVVVRLGVDGCLTSEHDILDGIARSVLER